MTLTKDEFVELYRRYIEVRFNEEEEIVNFDFVENYYDVGHMQFFSTKINEKYVIEFIGSNERTDWLFNFLFFKTLTPYEDKGVKKEIKVHKGFFLSYLLIRSVVHNLVRGKDKVFTLGQSLGAGISTLAALDIQYNFEIPVENYTTGCPRVGNDFFAESYKKRVKDYRFVNGNDIVPHLPFAILDFEHASDKILLRKDANPLNMIKNHMPKNYFESLRENL